MVYKTKILLFVILGSLVIGLTPAATATAEGGDPRRVVGRLSMENPNSQEGDALEPTRRVKNPPPGPKTQKEADAIPQSIPAEPLRASKNAQCDTNETKPAPQGEVKICVRSGKVAERNKFSRNAAQAAPLTWCDNGGAQIQITRTSLCAMIPLEIEIIDARDAVVGSLRGTMGHEFETSVTETRFDETFFFRVDSIDPALHQAIARGELDFAIGSNCTPNCEDGGGQPWTSRRIFPLVGTAYEGNVSRSWTNAVNNDTFAIKYTISTYYEGELRTGSWGGSDFAIRCDDQVGTYAGCVVPTYTPKHVVDAAKFPIAREYYGRAQAELSSHPGWEGQGAPLHREADTQRQKANRAVMCRQSIWNKEDRFGNHAHPHDLSVQCDEFPFAATKESGGRLGIESGEQCKQYTAWPANSADGWQTKPYVIHAYGYKSGSHQCARSSMTKKENEGAGKALGSWVPTQRVLDNDPFWLESGASTFNDDGPVKVLNQKTCGLRAGVVSEVEPKAAPEQTFINYAKSTPDGWTGGDSTYSVKLPDGRTLWLFSDTWIGPINSDGTRPISAPLVNNTFVIQDGSQMTTVHGGTSAEPKAIMPPSEPGHWYWLGDGKITKRDGVNVLQVLFHDWYRYGQGDWDWGYSHSVLATFKLSDLTKPETVQRVPSVSNSQWGAGMISDTESGDGYTYIYGVDESPFKKNMRLARVKGGDLAGRWEFMDPANSRWTLDERRVSNAMTGISNEYSVTPWAGQYMLLSQNSNEAFSNEIYAFFACSPAGPWMNKTLVYRMPETGPWGSYGDGDVYAYNAHVHPSLTRGGANFTFSYNVNSFDSSISPNSAHYRDPSIYKPRFVSFQVNPVQCRSTPARC